MTSMVHEFCMVLRESSNRTVAPLDAGTLIDVEFSYLHNPFVHQLKIDYASLLPGNGAGGGSGWNASDDGWQPNDDGFVGQRKRRVVRPLTPWEVMDNNTLSMRINGSEVLPSGFPLRWLHSFFPTHNDIRYRRAMSLACNGEGAVIEVASSSVVPILATFRYVAERSEFRETPTIYNVYHYGANGAQARLDRLVNTPVFPYKETFCTTVPAVNSLTMRPFLRDSFRGGVLGIAADYTANRGVLSNASFRCPCPGLLDGLQVSIQSKFGAVSVPFGAMRPGMSTSLERALYGFPKAEPLELDVKAEVPKDMEDYLNYTFCVVERRAERSKI